MLFNSIEFFIFLVVVVPAFFCVSNRLKIPFLFVASCIFYMAYVPVFILVIFFTIIVDYYAGIYIEANSGRNRFLILLVSLVVNIGVLVFFKYYILINEGISAISGFLGTTCSLPHLSVILPIGLSFHTFQAMSYTIEVYRGNQVAEKNLLTYSLYVMFFPQMVAGPIERPQNLLPQFSKLPVFKYANVVEGLKLIAWGLFKKIVIADRLAIIVNAVFEQPQKYEGLTLLVATFFFTFQIYCDFSGYSDIALGSAKMMGFDLVKNFDRPYISTSIVEFWKRWHISLGNWFKDYLYIPLGGNKRGLAKWIFNIALVFVLSGLWHGAHVNFILWGAIHACFYLFFAFIQKSLPNLKIPYWLGWGLTILIVNFAWIFFRSKSYEDAVYVLNHIFTGFNSSLGKVLIGLRNGETISESMGILNVNFTDAQWIFSFILIFLILIFQFVTTKENFLARIKNMPIYYRWFLYYLLVFSLLFFGKFDNKEFIYFQF